MTNPRLSWTALRQLASESNRLRDEYAALDAHVTRLHGALMDSGVEPDAGGSPGLPVPREDWLAYARKVAAECVRLRAESRTGLGEPELCDCLWVDTGFYGQGEYIKPKSDCPTCSGSGVARR